MVELLTVVAIIAMLVGLLIPSMRMVRNMAKNTKQKAEFATIDMALIAFKSDQGDYPESGWIAEPSGDYCGAQKLAEGLLGWDLMGFHPDSAWRADGLDRNGGWWTYDPDRKRDDNHDRVPDTLLERRGLYLELGTASAFKLGDLYGFGNTGPLAPNTYVLCDVFGVKKITLNSGETVMAGSPILYHRANTSSKTMINDNWDSQIYSLYDNIPLLERGRIKDGRVHRLSDPTVFYGIEGGLLDPKVNIPWPYRPDSYILISAGADGLYGTRDDVHNF
jgi:type II secretory pathway pseudopilin PulG